MRTLLVFVKTTLVGGLLFLVPIVLLLVIVEKALAVVAKLIQPLAGHFPNTPVLGLTAITLAASVTLLLVSFAAGLVATTEMGRSLVAWIERVFLSRMPGYLMFRSAVGDMSENLETLHGRQDHQAVLVPMGEMWQLGFVVDDTAPKFVAVFVPGAPSALSGNVCFIERERLRPSGLSIHEAGGILKRIGIGSAARLQKYL
jgi:uncharacterized membrane protein